MNHKKIKCLVLLLSGLLIHYPAQAHGYRGGFGRFSIGYGMGYGPFGGYYGPYGGFNRFGYGGYYAYPPAVITVPTTPPVYIQRETAAPPEPNYWYYCRSAQGYYPYVRECPNGWEKVAPQPPR